MTYEEHVVALRREAAALVAAVERDPSAMVPTCPGWTLDDLAEHVARRFAGVAGLVRDHADAAVDYAAIAAPGGGTAAWLEEATAELVDALSKEPPDAPVWNWSGQDATAAFWARRMAHEVAVHRWDAALALGERSEVDADLAADGVDESLNVFLPHALAKRPVDRLAGTFGVVAIDTGDQWWGRLRPDSSEVSRGAAPSRPDAELRGTAGDLLLALWGRPVSVEKIGNERITGLLTE